MHTDSYGRTWHFQPDHDTDRMLKLSNEVAAIGYNANHSLRTGQVADHYAMYLKDGQLEPYLLKSGDGKWYMGMRYGNSGSEYISPGLDARIISMMIELHRQKCSAKESVAVYTLVDGETF